MVEAYKPIHFPYSENTDFENDLNQNYPNDSGVKSNDNYTFTNINLSPDILDKFSEKHKENSSVLDQIADKKPINIELIENIYEREWVKLALTNIESLFINMLYIYFKI